MTVIVLAIAAIPTGTVTAPALCDLMCQLDLPKHTGIPDIQQQLQRGPPITDPDGPRDGTTHHMAAAYTLRPEDISFLLDQRADLGYRSTQLRNKPLPAAAALSPNRNDRHTAGTKRRHPQPHTRWRYRAAHFRRIQHQPGRRHPVTGKGRDAGRIQQPRTNPIPSCAPKAPPPRARFLPYSQPSVDR